MTKKLTTILGGLTLGAVSLFGGQKAFAQDDGWKIPPIKFPPIFTTIPDNIKNSVVCLRNTVIRKKPAYDAKGNLYFKKEGVISYGTGFVYMEKEGDCYVVTNHHVACDDEMYKGTKKVKDIVEIVDNMYDTDLKDDILLEDVVSSQARDIAILKLRKKTLDHYNQRFNLGIEIYKGAWGDSDTLRKGQTVVIEGFPHAIFQATTEGIVSNPDYVDFDRDYGWSHKCIIYDAATNPGNSGSPAFRKNYNGQLEWMGQVHAGYRAEGMKLFVAINEYKKMLVDLKEEGKVQHLTSTEVIIKSLLSGVDDKDNLENLFTVQDRTPGLFSDSIDELICRIGNKNDGDLEFIIYTGYFPYNTKTSIRLTDQQKDGYGSFDEIYVYTSKIGELTFDKKDFQKELGQNLDKLFDYLTKIAYKSYFYKKIVKKSEKSDKDKKEIGDLKKELEDIHQECSPYLTEFRRALFIFVKEKQFEKQQEEAEKR